MSPSPSPTAGSSPSRLVGVELEWLPAFRDGGPERLHDHPDHRAVRAAVAAAGELPGGGRVTFEPGGQLEISSQPQPGATAACDAASADLAAVRGALSRGDVALLGVGRDPVRPIRRVLTEPRYAAMEAYFDADGDPGACGRIMMCSTASVQVNIGLGGPCEAERRWRLAHRLAPTLAAVFANSPLAGGEPTGWKSSRLANWWRLDPSRTAPPPLHGFADAYARYALDARVMLFRLSADRYEVPRRPLTMGEWVARGHELGWPTLEDLDYHLTTLFPPVRPRGWLELRVLDALPDPWWRVAVAVTAALLDDPDAADEAARAAAAAEGLWVEAARDGLDHPTLANSGRRCFEAALAALSASAADAPTADAAACFYDRFVARGRSPADAVLETWAERPGLHALHALGREHAWTRT